MSAAFARCIPSRQQADGFPLKSQYQHDSCAGQAQRKSPPDLGRPPIANNGQRQRGWRANPPMADQAHQQGGLGILEAGDSAHGNGLQAVKQLKPRRYGQKADGHLDYCLIGFSLRVEEWLITVCAPEAAADAEWDVACLQAAEQLHPMRDRRDWHQWLQAVGLRLRVALAMH